MDAVVELEPQTVFSLAGLIYLVAALAAGVHVLLNKQNEASAFSWLGIIVLSPLLGAILYWLFGINRIRRRARAERPDRTTAETVRGEARSPRTVGDGALVGDPDPDPAVAPTRPPPDATDRRDFAPRWQQLLRLGAAIHPEPHVDGNAVEALENGDAAYPRMLAAIDSATTSVRLSSYIFSFDEVGRQFIDALVAAERRGVQVRVLIDGVGVSYGFSLTRVDRALRRQGVRAVRFLSAFSTRGTRFLNLRNHRKMLIVDGTHAFVGGLNIRANNRVAAGGRHATRDVHFEVSGPVVAQIDRAFIDDWHFAAGEALSPSDPPPARGGERASIDARVLLDGPDEDYAKLQMTMLAAINVARRRLRVVTPYFLPDRAMLNALQLAVLRGVTIDVIVPRRNNLAFVGWAMQANQPKLLRYGIRVHESPPPFDHSKLFVVDDIWSLIGSSNWDARSLELNFEVNLECYDEGFNGRLNTLIDAKQAAATRLERVPDTPLLLRLRNNFCRLFSPYL